MIPICRQCSPQRYREARLRVFYSMGWMERLLTELRWTLHDVADGMFTPLGILITFVLPVGLGFGALSGHSKYPKHARIRFALLVVMLYFWLGALVPLVLLAELSSTVPTRQWAECLESILFPLLGIAAFVIPFWAAVFAARRTYMLDLAQAKIYALRVIAGGTCCSSSMHSVSIIHTLLRLGL